MNMIGVRCPHCGADLTINDEIDTFYCNYCGGQIVMNGLSDAAYESRTKIKNMAHKENMLDKKNEHDMKDKKISMLLIFGLFGASMFIILSMLIGINISHHKNDKEYNRIVTEVQQDIANGDFDAAYVSAQSLVYPDSSESERKKKWDNTRRELINQIIETEKEATGKSTHKPEKKGLFD